MPDDDEKKVAELEEDEDDFSAVFAEAEKEDTEEKKETDEKSDDEKAEKSDESEEKADEEAEEQEEEQEEEDDLLTRGKELLDAEEAQKKEQEVKDKAVADKAAKEAAEKAEVRPLNETDVSNLMGIVDKNEIPDKEFEVNGVKVNPREFVDDNPEALVVGGLMAAKTINRMTKTGALVSGQVLNQKLEATQDLIWGNTFAAMVTMWHSDADDIVQSKEYTGWLDSQKKEVKALVKSGNPLDLIDVINRYKEDSIASKDDEKNKADDEAAKEKARAKKAKADKLLKKSKTPKKAAASIPGLTDMEDVDDDFSSGFNAKKKG